MILRECSHFTNFRARDFPVAFVKNLFFLLTLITSNRSKRVSVLPSTVTEISAASIKWGIQNFNGQICARFRLRADKGTQTFCVKGICHQNDKKCLLSELFLIIYMIISLCFHFFQTVTIKIPDNCEQIMKLCCGGQTCSPPPHFLIGSSRKSSGRVGNTGKFSLWVNNIFV